MIEIIVSGFVGGVVGSLLGTWLVGRVPKGKIVYAPAKETQGKPAEVKAGGSVLPDWERRPTKDA